MSETKTTDEGVRVLSNEELNRAELNRSEHDAEPSKIFHEIWTSQVGQPGYDKSKWKQLRQLLFERGIAV